MTEAELERLRRSVARGAPFGSGPWTSEAAERLGLTPSLNQPGRPAGPSGDVDLSRET
jgi:hypothetical protein